MTEETNKTYRSQGEGQVAGLRIALLSIHTCPLAVLGGKETGGMNVYVRDLAREYARRGHLVDVYTRAQNPNLPRVSRRLGSRARVIHVPTGPEMPYDKHEVYDHLPEFVERVEDRVRSEDIHYDILHSHYWLSGAAAYELRKLWGTPIVHMFHTLGKMKNIVAQRPEELETGRRIQTETDIVHFADALIAATPAEQRQLVDLYGADPERIHVISPGVDTERFYPLPVGHAKERIGICSGQKTILFVGRIEPLKGIDSLLRAIALVLDRRPQWRGKVCLPIIGGDPDRGHENAEMERLQALRDELGIGDVVTFLGAKDQDTLPYYYSAAEMVVMPSDYESFGMVALEAMACGTPVIVSDVGGLAFLVKDGRTGYRVPARDVAGLADRILRLLDDDALRRTVGYRASCWAESYAWPNIAGEIEGVYAELLAGNGAHPGHES
ncbi:MAG: glycosyltransferase [Anaerolineae bacterium]|nr:glycosyltransferase [Anaerolineae bacterium]